MRLLVQRIKEGGVTVNGEEIARARSGLCVFLGIGREDGPEEADYLARKAAELRIFEDENGRFNRSLADVGGEILVVSEFTLYGDCRAGKRPSFSGAAAPEAARPLYERFVNNLRDAGFRVSTGKFQAKMEVRLVNDGPVTLILEV